MESGDSSSLGLTNNVKKTERNRRPWSPDEERVLNEVMKDLVAKGWKTENGFKPGYLQKLQLGMIDRIPGTTIRAEPHINSRITIWKKAHASLQTMLHNNSGIGFNTITGVIDCNDDTCARVVKADPSATHMRFKRLPLYKDWNEIFGKDRANGSNAQNVNQIANDITAEAANRAGEQNHDQSGVDLDLVADMEVNSEVPTVDKPKVSRHSSKKRAADESSSNDKICEVIGQFCKSSEARMDTIIRLVGHEANLGNARKELSNMLEEIPDLTEDEKIDAAHLLAKNSDCLELFMGMAEGRRARYVRRLLSGHLKV